MKKRTPIGVVATLALACLAAPALGGPERSAEDRYYVEFRAFDRADQGVRGAGGRTARRFPERALVSAWLSERARENLARNPNVVAIESDPRRDPLSHYSSMEIVPYGVEMIQANTSPPTTPGNRTVCVIDSGYHRDHEDLDGSAAVTRSGEGSALPPFEDGCGHGTHVAGTIAAIANNGAGVVGVIPGVELHVVRVFGDDCGWAYSSDLVAALDECRAAGAHVVNMSLGGSFRSRFEDRAFRDAYKAGILSVAAAGNDGSGGKSYPASYDSVISVSAVDPSAQVASFSQHNNQVELAAPGVGILSSLPYVDESILSANGLLWEGAHLENAARGSASGVIVDGGLCTASGSWAGQIVLCERGQTSFLDKVVNVEAGGGAATVIYNNELGAFLGTLGNGNTSTRPAVTLSREDGIEALTQTGTYGDVTSLFGQPASGYGRWDGTSMATPHVSGAAALVWSHHPSRTNEEIRDALAQSALDLGAEGRDAFYGFGLVQAQAAIDLLDAEGSGCSASEIDCSNGIDDDCDGQTDGADTDCEGGSGSCQPAEAICSDDSECCSSKCKGPPSRKTCR